MILKFQAGKPLPSLQTIQALPKRRSIDEQRSIEAQKKNEEWTKKQIEKTKPRRTWRSDTADALHTAGVGLTSMGLVGSLFAAPVATTLGLVGVGLGERAVNKGLGKLADKTNSKVRTWKDLTNPYIGWSPTLQMMTNPGALVGGAIGGKAGSAIQKRIPIHLDRDAAGNWTGWLNIGKKQVRLDPRVAAANGKIEIQDIPIEKQIHNTLMNVAVKASKLQAMNKLDKTAIDGFVAKLKDYLSEDQAKDFIKRSPFFLKGDKKAIAIEQKALQNIKYKKGSNKDIEKAAEEEAAKTVEGMLELIRNKYAKQIEQLKEDSRRGKSYIDWSDLGGNNQLGGMDAELKASPVGFDETAPFLERYYQNVLKKISPLQKKLLDSGQLKVSDDGKHWMGLVDGDYIEVNPNRYVISHLPEANRFGNKVNVLPQQTAHIPVHGTKFKNWPYLTQPNNGYKKTLYTIIPDNKESTTFVIDHYKGTGVSMPVMTKPGLEPPPPQKGRTGNSNASGVSSGAPNGRVGVYRGVSDAQTQGTAIDEYDFGPNVENIKSYWNTLDFKNGAGPLAYNNKNSQSNLA